MVLEPGECRASPKTAAQAGLNGQMHCQGGVSTDQTHVILSFSEEQHPANDATRHGSIPCSLSD